MMYTQPMLQENALKDKVVFVTGGGTGLGKSMSEYFLKLGAKVAIASRKIDVLQNAANELMQATGGEVLPLVCDVKSYIEVEKTIDRIYEKWGRVDVLVNNAAGNFISPTERLSPKAFEVIMDIVLKGSVNCTLCLGKKWIELQKPGTVLSIVTTYATTGSGFVVPSAISKAGVIAMTKSLAIEWAKYGIRMNAIAPGPFPTEGAWERLFPESVMKGYDLLSRIPAGRVGHHQELANLAAYLVSDFSAYINGQVITIDSGETLKGAGEFNFLDFVPKETWEQIEREIRKK